MASAAVAAGLLLRRYLPRPADATDVRCVRCATPAAALVESFTCPGCGNDVREKGLAPAGQKSATAPLWAALTYTVIYLAAAITLTGVAVRRAPRQHLFTADTALAAPQSKAFAAVQLVVRGGGDENNPAEWRWELLGELAALDGGATVLEAQGPPGHWAVSRSDGRRLDSGANVDEDAVVRWMRAAGLDANADHVRRDAGEILAELKRMTDPTPRAAQAGSASGFAARSSIGGAYAEDATWPAPVAAALFAVVWPAGLWAILRRMSRRNPAVATIPAPPPPGPRAGEGAAP